MEAFAMKNLFDPLSALMRLILGVSRVPPETQKMLLLLITIAILVEVLFVTMTAGAGFLTILNRILLK
jgi:hypothetical protein